MAQAFGMTVDPYKKNDECYWANPRACPTDFGYKESLVNIVFGRGVSEAASNDGSPPLHLSDDGAHVDQIVLIRKVWHARVTDDPIEFLLSLLYHFGMNDHGEEKGANSIRRGIRTGAVLSQTLRLVVVMPNRANVPTMTPPRKAISSSVI